MSKPASHRQGIDLARFIAAFGVVLAHAQASPRDWAGHLSLALFAILTAYLAMKSAERAGGRFAYLPRARRLMLPWVIWSLFYWAVEYAVADGPDRFLPLVDPWSLLYGGFIHLWFLPFIAVAMLLVAPVLSFVTTPQRLIGASALLVGLSAPLFWVHEAVVLPMPLPQWAFTLPCYVLGLLVARAHGMKRPDIAIAAGGALSLMAIWMGQGAPWTFTVIIGFAAFELFWRLPVSGKWALHLGQVAFGIYLVHPFVMLVIYKFEGANIPIMAGAIQNFILSWAVVAFLRRYAVFARIT